jgi:hypothetical protein
MAQTQKPSTKRAPNNLSQSKKMTGYRFIEKDPSLDIVIARILESGRSPEWIERETEQISRRVSAACVIGWLYGGTRRPQNYTMESVMLALGVRKEWIVIDSGYALQQPVRLSIPPRSRKPKTVEVTSSSPPVVAQPPRNRVQRAVSKLTMPFARTFDWNDSAVIQRVQELADGGGTVRQIAAQIAKEFKTSVKPTSVQLIINTRTRGVSA